LVTCVTTSFASKIAYGVYCVCANNDCGGVAVITGRKFGGTDFTCYDETVVGEESVGYVEFLGIENCEIGVTFYDAVYAGNFVGGGDTLEIVGTVVTGFKDFEGGVAHFTAEGYLGVGDAQTKAVVMMMP
jgi:hypothetical protein